MTAITLHPDIEEALHRHAPVVVLESAVLTTGLPDRHRVLLPLALRLGRVHYHCEPCAPLLS